jgi:hypothetical protein
MAQTAAPPLLPVFRSRLQGELLALVLGDPAAEWTAEELSRRTGHPRHTVANELRRLEEAGVFTARLIGRSKLVRANTDSPYYEPLSRLALMSFGPPQVIREELGTMDRVEQLFIFGSWAVDGAREKKTNSGSSRSHIAHPAGRRRGGRRRTWNAVDTADDTLDPDLEFSGAVDMTYLSLSRRPSHPHRRAWPDR